MADEIKAVKYDFKLEVTEKIDLGIDNAANPEVIQEIAGTSGTLSPTTTVPATKTYRDQVALVAGAKTLDLELLVRDNLPDVVGTGLKVQFVKLHNPSTNTGTITMNAGAVNGYDILGSGGKVVVPIGGTQMFFGNDKLDDIASADSEVDFTGSGTEVFEITIVMG